MSAKNAFHQKPKFKKQVDTPGVSDYEAEHIYSRDGRKPSQKKEKESEKLSDKTWFEIAAPEYKPAHR